MPRRFKFELPEHEVRTMSEQGWLGYKNGKLLALMQLDGIEVLLTVDQNIGYQQNLEKTE